jgi:hypothetical protein
VFRHALIVIVLAAVLVGVSGAVGVAKVSATGMTDGWTQVVKGGFTDPNNSYVPSWAVFREYLYVSTAANESGSVFSGSSKAGGDIWRTNDGVTWEQVGTAGLGNPHNNLFQLVVFRDRLYAIANNLNDHGLEIWVTSDGVEFTKIEDGGFGDERNVWAFPWVFQDRLILGVSNLETGGEIWVSEDGTTFRRVVEGGMGHPGVTGFVGLDPWGPYPVFRDMLYIGVSNPTDGGEIWRTADGLNWERVADQGLTRTNSLLLSPSTVYKDQLYAFGTGGGTIDNLIGFDLYRTSDGTTWEQVIEAGFGLGGERNVSGGLVQFQGRLYLAMNNMDPRILNPSAPTERYELNGFQLKVSTDGKNWTQVGEDGFGTSTAFMAGLDVQGDHLYLSTVDYHQGGQLWRSADGEDWELVFQEPDPSFFQEGGGPLAFKGHFLWFSNDLKHGVDIWRSNEAMVAEETTTISGTSSTEGSGTVTSSGATGSAGTQTSGGWIALFAVLGVMIVASIVAVVFLAVRLTRISSGGGGTSPVQTVAQTGSDTGPLLETRESAVTGVSATPEARFCSACGQALGKEAKYCPGCGAPVGR